jgi:hypothetical protein
MKPVKLLIGGGLVVAAAGAIAFGIVYGAEKSSGGSGSGQSTLGAIAVTLDGHATTVRAHGEQMAETGRNASNQRWTDQGVALITTARQVQAVADQLRSTDRDLALFPPNGSVDIYRLRGDGGALIDAGQTLVTHADEMETQGDDMTSGVDAGTSGELRQTAETMKTNAATVKADGNSVIQAGQLLVDEAGRLETSLGH